MQIRQEMQFMRFWLQQSRLPRRSKTSKLFKSPLLKYKKESPARSSLCMFKKSALDTAAGIAASQLQNLIHRDHIEVTLNGVFEAGGCYGKFDSALGVIAV